MSLFALGNLMLKFKRNQLKREVRATWTQTFIALGGVIIALMGNIIMNPENLLVFLWYFFAMAVLVFGMCVLFSFVARCDRVTLQLHV